MKNLKKIELKNQNNGLDNSFPMLSHISYKRKFYSIDRFEKIFEDFDMNLDKYKVHKHMKSQIMLMNINKIYNSSTSLV